MKNRATEKGVWNKVDRVTPPSKLLQCPVSAVRSITITVSITFYNMCTVFYRWARCRCRGPDKCTDNTGWATTRGPDRPGARLVQLLSRRVTSRKRERGSRPQYHSRELTVQMMCNFHIISRPPGIPLWNTLAR